MDRIALKNYRCFKEEQSARLAPLTLLVGENSTGKTTLMTMIRALWDAVLEDAIPDFTEPPFNLGNFNDIIHLDSKSQDIPSSFVGRITADPSNKAKNALKNKSYTSEVTFSNLRERPVPSQRKYSNGISSIEQNFEENGAQNFIVQTARGMWRVTSTDTQRHANIGRRADTMYPIELLHWRLADLEENPERSSTKAEPLNSASRIEIEDVDDIHNLIHGGGSSYHLHARTDQTLHRPFATSAVRVEAGRTYDFGSTSLDPFGRNIPSHLAWLASREKDHWKFLKQRLERFGADSGLFNALRVVQLKRNSTATDGAIGPFQVLVRKHNGRRKGNYRNIVDMGYGVGQILPLVVQLLHQEAPDIMLLQQPEVHLHPRAAASFADLLCEVASQPGRKRKVIVETQSDFIIDRIRMSPRNGEFDLAPEDISILYFEYTDGIAQIHQMGVDERGNLLDRPDGYREFFLDESRRLWDLN